MVSKIAQRARDLVKLKPSGHTRAWAGSTVTCTRPIYMPLKRKWYPLSLCVWILLLVHFGVELVGCDKIHRYNALEEVLQTTLTHKV